MIESVVSMSEASIKTQKDGCSGIFQLDEHMEIGGQWHFQRGLGSSCALSPYLVLCISTTGLFLGYTFLY